MWAIAEERAGVGFGDFFLLSVCGDSLNLTRASEGLTRDAEALGRTLDDAQDGGLDDDHS